MNGNFEAGFEKCAIGQIKRVMTGIKRLYTPAMTATQRTSITDVGNKTLSNKIRTALNNPSLKAKIGVGSAVVGTGLVGYGLHKGINSLIGTTKPTNEW